MDINTLNKAEQIRSELITVEELLEYAKNLTLDNVRIANKNNCWKIIPSKEMAKTIIKAIVDERTREVERIKKLFEDL